MLILHLILAAIAAGALVVAPNGSAGAAVIAAAGAGAVALGTPLGPALGTLMPLAAFLVSAFALARIAEASGLAVRAADALAASARGSAARLYVSTCASCAALTAVMSLDGAVVLMVALLRVLAKRTRAPFAPLLTGSIVVANSASVAVPQGNPTNLVLLERAGVTPGAYAAHMLLPGVGAAVTAAALVAARERRALAAPIGAGRPSAGSWSAAERHALASLCLAAVGTPVALVAGVQPWAPLAAVAAVSVATSRTRPALLVPWRVGLQVGGLLVVSHGQNVGGDAGSGGPLAMLGVALAIGACCALANNLPVGAAVGGLVAGASSAYTVAIGLAIGALATPQGSVATVVALDLAGPIPAPPGVRDLAPPALAATAIATLLLWLTL